MFVPIYSPDRGRVIKSAQCDYFSVFCMLQSYNFWDEIFVILLIF